MDPAQRHVGGEACRGVVVDRAGDRERVGPEHRIGETAAGEGLRGEDHPERATEGSTGRRIGEGDCH